MKMIEVEPESIRFGCLLFPDS